MPAWQPWEELARTHELKVLTDASHNHAFSCCTSENPEGIGSGLPCVEYEQKQALNCKISFSGYLFPKKVSNHLKLFKIRENLKQKKT